MEEEEKTEEHGKEKHEEVKSDNEKKLSRRFSYFEDMKARENSYLKVGCIGRLKGSKSFLMHRPHEHTGAISTQMIYRLSDFMTSLVSLQLYTLQVL